MLRIPAELEKANEDRLLPIAPEFADFLFETPEAERTGPVFGLMALKGRGARPGLEWVSTIISTIGEKAGVKVATDPRTGKVKYASAHDFRRAFGERWATRVMPPILQQLMRHASIDTTLRFYVGRNAETAAAAVWESVGRSKGNTSGNSQRNASGNTAARVVAKHDESDT